MAKWHYVITSKKRAEQLQNKDLTQRIIVDEVIELHENKKKLFPIYNFDTGKPDKVFNFLITLACAALLMMILTIIIGKDIKFMDFGIFKLASDIVASAGLFLTVISFPKPKLFITKKLLKHGYIGNDLIIVFYSLILPLYFAIFLYGLNIGEEFANIISLICVFITLWNFCH